MTMQTAVQCSLWPGLPHRQHGSNTRCTSCASDCWSARWWGWMLLCGSWTAGSGRHGLKTQGRPCSKQLRTTALQKFEGIPSLRVCSDKKWVAALGTWAPACVSCQITTGPASVQARRHKPEGRARLQRRQGSMQATASGSSAHPEGPMAATASSVMAMSHSRSWQSCPTDPSLYTSSRCELPRGTSGTTLHTALIICISPAACLGGVQGLCFCMQCRSLDRLQTGGACCECEHGSAWCDSNDGPSSTGLTSGRRSRA